MASETYALCGIYATKIQNFFIKRFGGEILETEGNSCYSPSTNSIKINPKDQQRKDRAEYVKWHEIGHAIWRMTESEPIRDLVNEILTNIPVSIPTLFSSIDEVVEVLDFLSLEYKTGHYGISPISDLLGMVIGKRIPHYLSHPDEYKSTQDSLSSEWAANIVAIIATRNWGGVKLASELCPNSFIKVLDAIDKSMHLEISEN